MKHAYDNVVIIVLQSIKTLIMVSVIDVNEMQKRWLSASGELLLLTFYPELRLPAGGLHGAKR